MRKIYVSLLAILFTISTEAQITFYNRTVLSGQTYTPITGGTIVNTNAGLTPGFASGNQDDGGILVTLPFTFTYDGLPYTQMSMCTNGWVAVGNQSVISAANSNTFSNFFTTTNPNNTIAAWFKQMGANFPLGSGAMVHGLVGTDVYAFEWRNAVGNGFTDGASVLINFMVKIYGPNSTNPGRIQLLYGSTTGTLSLSCAIGIEDATGGVNHFINAFNGSTTSNTPATAWPGNGGGYQFDPPPPCVTPVAQATALVLTASTGSVTGSFTAASPAPSGYLVVRTTSNIAPVPVNGTYYTVGNSPIGYIESVGTSTSFTSSFLNGNTQYYYWVFSYSDLCSGGMPFYLTTAPLSASATTMTCSITGTQTVGPTGNYPTLAAAANAVVANGISGPVVLELQSTYTSAAETYPITLGYVPCASNINTITIRPAAGATGLSITGSSTTPILDINSGKYWRVDGRPGGVGTISQLTIANTSTTGVAVKFINDAQYNLLDYLDMQGQNTTAPGNGVNSSAGVVYISNTNLLNATGNDFNSITNCSIHGTPGNTPAYGIFAFGSTTTVASNNDSITISNNNIYDFFTATGASTGIKADVGNNAWTISGNSFYETAPRVTTANNFHRALWITPNLGAANNPASGFVITGNFIGGTAPLAGGGPLTMTGAFPNTFQGMELFVGLGTPTLVQNNIIRNLAISTTSGAGVIGISQGNGHINITGNTVGSSTTTGDITVTTTATGGGTLNGYRANGAAGSIVNFTNNTFAGVTTTGAVNGVHISGILIQGATTINVTNNTIGSTTIANSVNAASASLNTQLVNGIAVNGGTSTYITGNTIANLNNNYTGTVASGVIRGITVGSSTCVISNNLIYNLSNSAPINNAVTGIQMTSTAGAITITGNTIHSLVSNNTNLTVINQVTGISFTGGTAAINTISNNFIHSFDVVAANPNGYITGIDNGGGTNSFINNMIRLGIKADGSSVTNIITVRGITSLSSSALNNFYHNSIYIGGTGVTSSVNNSFAFTRTAASGAYDIRNNIFSNVRSNATTGGKHYAVHFTTAMAGVNIDYNVYEYSGTGGVFTNNGTTDVATYTPGWYASDVHSFVGNPLFANATGTAATANLHLIVGSIAEGTGINIPSVTDDFDGQTRSGLTPTDIGADAGNYGATGVDVGATVLVSPLAVGCGSSTQTVVVRIRNYSSNSINFVTNPVTVTVTATGPVSYNSNIVVNTGTLAAGGILDVTLPATINTSAAGTYVFNASTSVTGDVNATNDVMAATNLVISAGTSLSGAYTVGAGGNYTTLTAAVAAYNTASCISGNVIFNLTDPLYNAASGETFPIRIQHINNPANYTLTIKPASGVNAIIEAGPATSDSAVIKLNGADNIIIDGSNNGTDTRNLTIQNGKTTVQTSGIWVASLGGVGNGAVNNSVKNLVIIGPSSVLLGTQGYYGVVSSANTLMNVANADNDNLTVTNNAITKTMVGISALGTVVAQEGLLINNNVIGSNNASETVSAKGIEFGYANDAIISGNTISNIVIPSGSGTVTGIYVGAGTTGGKVDKNKISKVYQPATFTYAQGINLATTTISGLTVSNNMISDIRTSNYSTITTSNAVGIILFGGNNVKIYNNTVNMSGNITGGTGAGMSSNVMITTTSVSNLDFRNNNLSNTQDFAINGSVAYNILFVSGFQFGTINNNNYYGQSTSTTTYRVGVGSTSSLTPFYATLTDWKAFTSQDLNSIAIQPPFVSATDGHIDIALGALLDDKGTPLAGITTDIDGDVRNVTTPDIGADEFTVVTGIDFGAKTLVSPVVKQCYSNSETVTVRIRNYSANNHNFAAIPVTVNASVTGPNPQTFAPVIVNTGTLAPGDSLAVVISTNYDMSALGAYTFNASTTVSADVSLVNNAMPVTLRTLSATAAGTVSTTGQNQFCISGTPFLNLTGSNGSTIQWQSAPGATGPWTNVGTNSTSYVPGGPITTTTYYRAYVVCNANSDTATVQTMIVNNPLLLSTTPATRCGPGTLNLSATGSTGTDFNWYTLPTNGSLLYTGASYTTPVINTTTTYYVSASMAATSSTVGVSPTATTCGSIGATTSTDLPLRFNTTAPVTINSAWVIPVFAGTVTVSLRQALSAVNIQTASFNFTTAQVGVPQQINLGWAISTPGNYQLTNSVNSLNRIGTFNCAYPFTSAGGAFSIVGGANSSTLATTTFQYNSFFDINISEGCESPRQAVIATVTPAPAFDVTNNLTVCNNAIANLQVNSTLSDFNTYVWTPVAGLYTNAAATTAYTAGTNASTVYARIATPDTYTFVVQANNTTTGCQNFDSVKVTVLPAAITVVPSPFELCVSGISTLSIPNSSTFGAAQYQWQSSPNNTTYTNIPSATGSTYTTPTISASTYYKVDLKNSAGVSCATAYDTVIVNAPALLSTTPAAICGPGVMTLAATATAGSTVNWYNSFGGLVGTGATFTTPNLTATTTYFAAALNGGNSVDVGIKPSEFAICGVPANTTTTGWALRFNTIKAVMINSAYLVPQSTLPVLIELRPFPNGPAIASVTKTFTPAEVAAGTPIQVPFGFSASTPGNYQLVIVTGGSGRITTLGCGYPFNSPSGSFSITGSATSATTVSVTTAYNTFYGINITEGCESPKVAVVAQVSPNTTITQQPASISTCVGASINLVVGTQGANLVYQWRKNGVNIANSNNDTLTINPISLADAGTYDVVITGLCGNQTSAVSTVNVSAANTWVGTVSTNWDDPANWCGGVPTSTTDVAIFSGTPFQPVINATLAYAKSIIINNGASLTLQPNGTLNLFGDFTNNGSFIAADGYVFFKGTTNQNVAGMTVGNIMVNGASGVTLTGGMTVGTSAVLSNGNLTLGVNNLTVTGNITGNLASHIVTNATGSVITRQVGALQVNVPVGPSTSSYNPVTIANGSNRDYAVRVATGLNPTIANPGKAVNRTWTITPAGAGNPSNVNMTFQYEDTHMNTPGIPTNTMEIGAHNGSAWALAVASSTPGGTPTARTVGGAVSLFGSMVVSNIGGISWITATPPPVDPTVSSVKMLPNLVETSSILRVISTRSAKIHWNIIDAQGRVVMSFDKSVLQGQNDIQLQLTQLAGGVYTLSGTTDKGLTSVVKFVKQ